jgi:succinate dehydrogenase/fumarate reductase cytochrome b subunit
VPKTEKHVFFLCILMHGLRSVDHLLMDLGYARHAAKFVNSCSLEVYRISIIIVS